jgi:hypothetical protein
MASPRISSSPSCTRTGRDKIDVELDIFRSFLQALTRASGLFRQVSPDALLASLEPKRAALRLVRDLYEKRRTLRLQTTTAWKTLMQSEAWRQSARLLEGLPEELSVLAYNVSSPNSSVPLQPTGTPTLPKLRLSSNASKSPEALKDSPSKNQVLKAAEQQKLDARRKRMTRLPMQPPEELLESSKALLEALNYSASGERDEVSLALELFGRAVRQVAARRDSQPDAENADKDAVDALCQSPWEALEIFEPKDRTLDFFVDVSVHKAKYKSRVKHLLSCLSTFTTWKIFIEHKSEALALVTEALPSLEDDEDQTCSTPPAKAACGNQEVDTSIESLIKDDPFVSIEMLVRQRAPWYLRLCIHIFGPIRTLRKCKCLIPRDLKDSLEKLLDDLNSDSAKSASKSVSLSDTQDVSSAHELTRQCFFEPKPDVSLN